MKKRPRYRTARAVLQHDDHFLLAVHSSFWAKRERRWGLPGGGIERGEHPQDAVQRELEEELDLYLTDFIEIGAYAYKGHDHIVYGAQSGYRVDDYDDKELLDLGWFSITQISEMARAGKLHAGYELQAIEQFFRLQRSG